MIIEYNIFKKVFNLGYNVGDYILLDNKYYEVKGSKVDTTYINLGYQKVEITHKWKHSHSYSVRTMDGGKFVVFDDDIVRRLTFEEVEEIKVKKLSQKYNL